MLRFLYCLAIVSKPSLTTAVVVDFRGTTLVGSSGARQRFVDSRGHMDDDLGRRGYPEDRLSSWPQRTQRAPPPSRYNPPRSIIVRPARATMPPYHEDHQQQQQQQPPRRSYQLEEYPVDVEGFDHHPQRRVLQEESYWQDHRQPERPVLDRRDQQLHRSFSPVNRGPAPLDPHLWQDSAFVPSPYNDQPRHSSPAAEDEWITGMLSARSILLLGYLLHQRSHMAWNAHYRCCKHVPHTSRLFAR